MRRALLLLVAFVVLMTGVRAQDTDRIIDLSSKAARIARAVNGRNLTGPSGAGRPEIVSAFLANRHGGETIASLVMANVNATAQGITHVQLAQRVAGLEVYGTYVKAALTPAGELVSVIENLAPAGGALLPSRIDYRDALVVALQRRYPGEPTDLPEVGSAENRVVFGRGDRFHQDPAVTRVAIPLQGGQLRIGYLVETWDRQNQLWHTIVNGNERILFEELRTASDRYNVFTNQPLRTAQTVVDGPGSGNAESPIGWVFNNTTIGNNVDAYVDADNNNSADTNGRPVVSNQDFLAAFNLTIDPRSAAETRAAAVTNLFFLNNVIHDKLYRHGFTEAAGNFQADNFGNGGSGNDPVNAEAQDGGGTNNANFATPSDGSRPRMQMYIWTQSSPVRDGDVDSDIVYHEYGHGLTWRMIGGMGGPLAGAIGEGMSDTVALYINGDDAVAEYSYNRASGIRRYRYTNYPLTYSSVTGSSVHNDGEIYAAAMWRLRELWLASGRSMDALWDVVVGGMNFTPSRPAYEDMRDGILAASTTTEGDCVIWQAFAQFGIGQGADGRESCFGPFCSVSITQSFVVPSICSSTPPPNTAPSVTISTPANNSSFTVGTAISFSGSASDAEDGSLSSALVWTSSRDGQIGTGASFSRADLSVGTHTIAASVTDSGNLTGSAGISITITETLPPPSGITLTAAGYKVKGVRHADLSWSGASGTHIEVYRNGVLQYTTANDGAHTDVEGGKGGGTFTYKVCEIGGSVCSPTVTVVY
ncbi:MAG TPA: M36 family metallopeptidase [Vicinamibacterales bacterium]|nr:M36 family metallopeptidase [Vicinamibacterales bacterium]